MYRQWKRYAAHAAPDGPSAAQGAARSRRQTGSVERSGGPVFVGQSAGPPHAGVGAELSLRLAGLGAGSVLLALLVFLAVPSRQPVMRVELLQPDRSTAYPAHSALYLRGAVLSRYEKGRWSCDSSWLVPPYHDPLTDAPRTDLPIQRITVEPLDRGELCCLWPFYPCQRGTPLDFRLRTRRLARSSATRLRRFSFELATTALLDGGQRALVPARQPIDPQALLQMPALPRLSALAAQWDAESGLPREDRLARAQALEQRLRCSPRFAYSLQGQPRRAELDPIEDFVSEHPQGHCEYFATALALMLRSRGIPSRLVIGYCSDEFDPATQSFRVRQLHAHAWVEAYLEPRHLPAAALRAARRTGEDYSGGAWLRLDPTPPAARTAHASAGPMAAAYGWLEDLWRDYVLELDLRRQRAALYGPVVEAAGRAARRLVDRRWWSAQLARLWQAAGALPLGAVGRVAGLALLGAAGVVLIWLFGRLLGRGLAKLRRAAMASGRRRLAQTTTAVEFYRRFESLLARHGLVRRIGQTQREFARSAARRIEAIAPGTGSAELVVLLAETFYQVRFGHHDLRPGQAEAVEEALARLRAALRTGSAGSSSAGPNRHRTSSQTSSGT